jgi:histidyl-tRNA synthetase
VATRLRKAGQQVDLILEAKKAKWVFKYSDRIQSKYCWIVGADEYAQGEASVKNLATGDQENIQLDAITKWVADQTQK